MITFRHHRTARSPRWASGAGPLAVAATLLLAACAGSSSDTDATDSSPATTDAPQATEPPEPVEPGSKTSEPAEASTSLPVVSEPGPVEAESVNGVACDSEPVVMTTAGRIDYVRLVLDGLQVEPLGRVSRPAPSWEIVEIDVPDGFTTTLPCRPSSSERQPELVPGSPGRAVKRSTLPAQK